MSIAIQAISIVATVRNERKGIRTFVDSLLAQQLKPEEIIIVDGESTDGTLEILREYEHAGLISVISRKCNIAEGRNIGVQSTRNDLIAVTDAGCRVAPDWLFHISQCFSSDDSPDVVAGNYDFETRTSFERACVFATNSPRRETSDLAKYFPSSRSIAFKKGAWERAKGYPEWLYAGEDTLFNIRLRQLGLKFKFCREAKVTWRPRSTWRALWNQQFLYARGNGRTGVGIVGYVLNLQYHISTLLFLLLGSAWRPLAIIGVLIFAQHVQRNLWAQAKTAAQASGHKSMFLRVLVIMEFTRIAGMFGFVAGRYDRLRNPSIVSRHHEWMGGPLSEAMPYWPNWANVAMSLAIPCQMVFAFFLWDWDVAVPAAVATFAIALKSMRDFSRTGPQLKEEVLQHYRGYLLIVGGRLTLWTFVLCMLMASAGALFYESVAAVWSQASTPLGPAVTGFAAIALITAVQFSRHLLFIPASIAASANFRLSRLYPFWRHLSPGILNGVSGTLAIGIATLVFLGAWAGFRDGDTEGALTRLADAALLALIAHAATWSREPRTVRVGTPRSIDNRPNILMIGVDTLRADRLGVNNYGRSLTPTLDELARRGTYLANCYVPCARTAPSLASLLSGCWPKTHGIRDNFAQRADANTEIAYLPELLKDAGYLTVAASDWAGADLGKYPFGFEACDLPRDQWNLKYLLRQGPKDIRLFLSLFTHNRFGKKFLPELYYLAGIPMTTELGQATRSWISHLATTTQPFFINVFFSTAHAPFGSEYPYYGLFSEKDYSGPSKFVMANLSEPFEIVERQRLEAKHFDLSQIINLYDGCVRRFDDEVARILEHLQVCGLEDNTIVIVYADHGIEFFERDTWGQGNSVLVDDSARIPVLILDPEEREGRIVREVTRSIDLAPTILERLSLPIPESMEGVSLLSTVRGSMTDTDLPAFVETGIWFTRIPGLAADHLTYPDLPDILGIPDKSEGAFAIRDEFQTRVIEAKDRMVRQGRWKLTYCPLRGQKVKIQLFDTIVDPHCRSDVADQNPDVLAELSALMANWLKGDAHIPIKCNSMENRVTSAPR